MELEAIEQTGRPIERRRLLRWLLAFSIVSTAAMVITPIVGFLIPPRTVGGGAGGRVPVGKTTDLPPGNGKVVAMGSKPVIVVSSATGVNAFSAVCTHLGCIVQYDETSGHILCPCHDGHFSPTNGAVISGPPPAPLPAVEVAVDKDEIFLVGG